VGRKEQAEASRAGLIEAARHCFSTRGYEATTVAAILDRAGMARGALYHYFPNGKREIFGAVFETINEEFHRRRDAMAAIDSPLERVRAGIRVFLRLCTQDDFARIALIDAPRLVPGQAERGSSYALLRAQLEEAGAAGETRSFHVEAMAIALYGAVRSAGELVIAASDRDHAAATAVQAIELLLDGLRAT
jgi:AcrR family transcriptional regulator